MGSAVDEAAQAAAVTVRLRRRIEANVASEGEISASVRRAWAQFAAAPVRTFIPVLVEHQVLQQLRSRGNRVRSA